jgi:hypothetical protein
VTGNLQFDQHDGLTAKGKASVSIAVSADVGEASPIQAFVDVAGFSAGGTEGAFGAAASPFVGTSALDLVIKSAYLTSTGAWLSGLPDVTTVIGRFDRNYNDWVAKLGTNDGVEINASALGLGDVKLLWALAPSRTDGDTGGQSITAVQATADLDTFDLDFTLVSESNTDPDPFGAAVTTRSTDSVVIVGIAPSDGVSFDATFGSNGDDTPANAYKIGGSLGIGSGWTLDISNWNTDADFDPQFINGDAKPAAGSATQLSVSTDTLGQFSGVKVTFKSDTSDPAATLSTTTIAADTEVGGIGVNLGLVSKSDVPQAKYTVKASQDISGVTASYSLTIDHDKKTSHVIDAKTTLAGTLGTDVALSGKVTIKTDAETQFDADATWSAPNGFDLGLHYANYDKSAGKVGGAEADGFYLTAGASVDF